MIDRNELNINENGQTIIEFALIAIFFFMILFGIIEFALLMFNQQVITNAAREGARFGVVARPVDFKVTKSDVVTETEFFAQNHVVSFAPNNFSVNAVFNDDISQDQCNEFQQKLEVTVGYDYSFLILPMVTRNIEARAIMLCE
jgi:Flp pilus assembly protein TadG